MEIKGTIINVLPLESGVSKTNGNPWSKATIIIETDGQYPKKVAMSNMKQAEEFARLPIGAKGTFRIDVESREYNGRWFTNVNCFGYELEGQQPIQSPPQQAPQPQYQQPQAYAQPQRGYAPSPQSSGYQQPPQGYTQGYQQPPQPQADEDLPF